jgi:DNA-binding transcriptional MerR regulator
MTPESELVRISELARRTGVTPQRLRAWEGRYGFLEPTRSAGGYRLYSGEDERRVRLMLEQLARGLAPAEAAAVARDSLPASPPDGQAPDADVVDGLRDALSEAMGRFDGPRAHEVLDELHSRFSVDAVLQRVVIPYLHELGQRWSRGKASVAQEHFASRLLEARMLALARGWERGPGRTAVLACAPRELHTLGLVAFGVALHNRGWAVCYLGADSPIDMVHEAIRAQAAEVAVLSAVDVRRFTGLEEELRALARDTRLLLGGEGATEKIVERVGGQRLDGDPVAAAEELAA